MSHLFRASLLISAFFGINKIVALLRQYLIAKQFGFSPEIDAFNVANNMPDLIFSLFSGGALAMAFIPVFAEYLEEEERHVSWRLFSKVATVLFAVTTLASLLIAILAPSLVRSEIGVAPGFSPSQQQLVVDLLRINLLATIVFSMSGLVTASLQAHKHFFLPAAAPIFYNLGIILGAIVLAPTTPLVVAGLAIPTLGMGIYGLTYGVVIGALLHLLVQIPGIVRYQFKFTFSFDLRDEGVRKILRLVWPRVLTVLLIQIMFLLRDNFASRLEGGSVTALTYGYFIMQVPETLIGTAIATALLPTLSSHVSEKRQEEFARVLSASIRIIIASSLAATVIISLLLPLLLDLAFDFSQTNSNLLVWTTRAFTFGLLAHTLLEVAVRAFYAHQQAKIPLYATAARTIVFIVLAVGLYKQTGAIGIAAVDSIAVAVETIILLALIKRSIEQRRQLSETFTRSVVATLVAWAIILAILKAPIPPIAQATLAILLACTIYGLFVLKEIRLLFNLDAKPPIRHALHIKRHSGIFIFIFQLIHFYHNFFVNLVSVFF